MSELTSKQEDHVLEEERDKHFEDIERKQKGGGK